MSGHQDRIPASGNGERRGTCFPRTSPHTVDLFGELMQRLFGVEAGERGVTDSPLYRVRHSDCGAGLYSAADFSLKQLAQPLGAA